MRSQVRATLLSALPSFAFGRRARNFSTLQRRLPPLLRPAAGRAALSTLPSFSAAAAAAQGISSQSPGPLPAPAPITTTASSCTPETARGRHVFKVGGYSLLKGLGVGRFVRSATFAVGGYDWCVRYCPDGDRKEEDGHGGTDNGAVFLALMTREAEVRALFDFRLVNPATGGMSPSIMSMERPMLFNDVAWSFGNPLFRKRSNLEASDYLQDDCLVIQCDVTVIKDTPEPQSETVCDDIVHSSPSHICIQEAPPCDTEAPAFESKAPSFDIQVPPSVHDIRGLFEAVKPADVTISVKGVVFHAHSSVIATRMPVFIELELWERNWISMDYIKPAVFKALLHFIYTDLLPDTDDDLEGADEKRETVKGLLEAADTYGLDRLKLMCESILCKELSVENVAATLELANWHHCKQLKHACIGFITSPGRMNDVVATEGFKHLKVTCPSAIKEISEKETKSSKIL